MELEGQPLLQATVRDETAMKGMQAGLAQADRLASMGMLAAGVAHEDINNPLTYVLYNAKALADDLPRVVRAAIRCSVALRERNGDAVFAAVAGDDAALLDPAMLEDMANCAREVLIGAIRIGTSPRRWGPSPGWRGPSRPWLTSTSRSSAPSAWPSMKSSSAPSWSRIWAPCPPSGPPRASCPRSS